MAKIDLLKPSAATLVKLLLQKAAEPVQTNTMEKWQEFKRKM